MEWPSEKKNPTAIGHQAFLHQLACDIVDSCDVIGVEGVAQPEAIGEESHTEQQRLTMELDQRPQPSADIADDEERVKMRRILLRMRSAVSSKSCESISQLASLTYTINELK